MSESFSIRETVLRAMTAILGEEHISNAIQSNAISWSSIQHIHIVMALEDVFDIELEDDKLSRIKNYVSLVQVVEETINEKEKLRKR